MSLVLFRHIIHTYMYIIIAHYIIRVKKYKKHKKKKTFILLLLVLLYQKWACNQINTISALKYK
jgi:hypothetical protein